MVNTLSVNNNIIGNMDVMLECSLNSTSDSMTLTMSLISDLSLLSEYSFPKEILSELFPADMPNFVDDYTTIISSFAIILGCYISQLDAFISSNYTLVGITKHKFDSVQKTKKSDEKRSILELDDNCYRNPRFTKSDFMLLKELSLGTFCPLLLHTANIN